MRHIEDTLQRQCVAWWDYTHQKVSHCLLHIPNGGKRNAREAARFKAMGVRAGAPDLLLIIPSGGYNLLAMELKVGKNGQTANQKYFQQLITEQGGLYVVVRSLDQFIDTIENYLT